MNDNDDVAKRIQWPVFNESNTLNAIRTASQFRVIMRRIIALNTTVRMS